MQLKGQIINSNECQFSCLQSMAEGNAETPPISIVRHLKLFVRRHISTKQDRFLHQLADNTIAWYSGLKNGKIVADEKPQSAVKEPLKAGDTVRVKSKEDIEATLNHIGQLKGCSFMADIMTPYCGTVQRVLKPMERFVDERDLRVKKCKGLILLEGVMCQGTTAFGRCDRSCLMFWREEWLEKI